MKYFSTTIHEILMIMNPQKGRSRNKLDKLNRENVYIGYLNEL